MDDAQLRLGLVRSENVLAQRQAKNNFIQLELDVLYYVKASKTGLISKQIQN